MKKEAITNNRINVLFNVSKYILGISILLIIYSKVVRVYGVFYFWESSYIGTALLIISVFNYTILFFIKKRFLVSVNHIVFIAVYNLMWIIFIAQQFIEINSESYTCAKDFLYKNTEIRRVVGNVNEVIFMGGSIDDKSNNPLIENEGRYVFIVKGEHKYADYRVFVRKPINQKWEVDKISEIDIIIDW